MFNLLLLEVSSSSSNLTKNVKSRDLRLAMFILQHSAITSVDHLGELLSSEYEGGCAAIGKIKMYQTKCASLIRKVIGASYLEEIVRTIGNNRYACIVDESTDISLYII